MKYYWIASTIEIKTSVLPSREINIKNYVIFMLFLLILSHFRPFLITFKVILLIIFIDFLIHFIDHFTIFLGHQNPGPDFYYIYE